MCAPGGGVERGCALPDNLIHKIHEETGLHITVNEPCLINEFHNPNGSFHQVDSLAAVAWQDADAPMYDPLEPIIA